MNRNAWMLFFFLSISPTVDVLHFLLIEHPLIEIQHILFFKIFYYVMMVGIAYLFTRGVVWGFTYEHKYYLDSPDHWSHNLYRIFEDE